ncbi:hypothetical protein [Paracidovorax oryzae]|uniref:hypothetical protein n=1 Tax=Paracidovorax oryzae TaxID=862720 RepID=UPI0012EB2103|nr:hypothetical protein [Paracidovorax oryzae]
MADKIDNCRGDEKKKQICRDYEVRVISRMVLLPERKIEGCCGDLENEHTIFYYKHKKTKYEDTFSVGKDCAKAFLGILGQQLPPLVDPLQHMQIPGLSTGGGQGASGAGSQSNPVGSSSAAIPKINSEMYVAINLWCILKNQAPKFALQRILNSIQAAPSVALQEKDVFDFLKVLASYRKTLKQMLSEAKNTYPNMKSYTFPTLNTIASKNWIDLP